MAWMTAGASILSSLGASSSAKKQAKRAFKNQKELTTLEATLQRQNSQFSAEQEHYYKQLDRKAKSRGLDEFRKFGTVKNWDPTYSNSNPGPIVPDKPDYNRTMSAPVPAAPQPTRTVLPNGPR